ncbi:MAG: hypothetical protein ACJLS2_07110 [Microcella pacifica]
MTVAELAYQVLGNRATLWRSTRRNVNSGSQVADGLSSTGEGLDIKVSRERRHARQATTPAGGRRRRDTPHRARHGCTRRRHRHRAVRLRG